MCAQHWINTLIYTYIWPGGCPGVAFVCAQGARLHLAVHPGCICVYICIHMYTYVCICIYMAGGTPRVYMCIYICMYMYICPGAHPGCICILYVYICIHMYTYAYVYYVYIMYTYVYSIHMAGGTPRVYMGIYAYICMYVCMCIYICLGAHPGCI